MFCPTYLCAHKRTKQKQQDSDELMQSQTLAMHAGGAVLLLRDQDKYLPGIQTRACGLSQQVNFCWECRMDKQGSFCVMWLHLQQSRNPPKKLTYILCRFTQLPTIRPRYYSTSPRSFALVAKMFSCIFEILVKKKKSGSILFFLLPWKLLLLVFAAPR